MAEVPATTGNTGTPAPRARLWLERGLWSLVGASLLVTACYLAFQSDRASDRRLPARFQLDMQSHLAIDPDLLHYEPVASLGVSLTDIRAISVGSNDDIFVAGDQSVQVIGADGATQRIISVDGSPTCIAVGRGEAGRLYVGIAARVDSFELNGRQVASWEIPNGQAILTSIAVADQDVLVADAQSRTVWRFDSEGSLIGQIGKPDSGRDVPQFVVPGPQFDIVVGVDDLVHVANPGRLQVATVTLDGDLGAEWGRPGSALADFFGCCNPVHIAVMPDGRYVTSEKGIPRVKVYNSRGEFEGVVAGPGELDVDRSSLLDPRSSDLVFDVAVDSRGRVLVLDPRARVIRVFEPNSDHNRFGAAS